MNKVELLAPAGNLEKLKMAIMYGADAVYIGGQKFGLRASADNFSLEDIKEGLDFAHQRECKVYVTVNIIPHNEDLEGLPEYIKQLDELGIDAVIVSDPGIFDIVRENAPDMEIHISTQLITPITPVLCFGTGMGLKELLLQGSFLFKK